VHILYLVSAIGNPLYNGRYELHGRYMTFGQQSFIYDLVAGLAKRGDTVTLAIEGIDRFPLTEPLRQFCRIIDPRIERIPEDIDLAIFDEGADRLLAYCPSAAPAFRIVHNAATPISDELRHRCDRFICLTERSLQLLSAKLPTDELTLLHQAVDLDRFRPVLPRPQVDRSRIRVLVYSRLDANREPTIWRLLEELEFSDVRVTVLGDGDSFWKICDRFGASVTPVHFIPCTSIQNFQPNFDVVISSARGVMEALAMGLPAICGGFEYAGPVLESNIRDHLTVNITGFEMGVDAGQVPDDIASSALLDWSSCRALAEEYCSVQAFIDGLLRTLSTVEPSPRLA
jgi:hypothetical protein